VKIFIKFLIIFRIVSIVIYFVDLPVGSDFKFNILESLFWLKNSHIF